MPPFPRLSRLLHPPTYPNTGSTARDHLASERTFLAWLRTGLGFVALGIAVERFSQLDLDSLVERLRLNSETPTSSPIGSRVRSHAQVPLEINRHTHTHTHTHTHLRQTNEHLLVATLLGSGFGSIVYGVARYFSTMRMLERGLFRPAYFGAAGVGVLVSGVAGGAYWGVVRGEVEGESGKGGTMRGRGSSR